MTEKNGGVRVDLHLHSRASGVATNWWVRGLGTEEIEVRESYTPPEAAYGMAKAAGMDFVTLTDHETIEGALTLLHHPDFFAGEEVSARFPENGQYVDVLLYGVDAGIHTEAQARRDDVYDLVDYLREAGVAHALAHPLYGMPGPLSRGDVEKRLALFGLWELINGSRPAAQNRLAAETSRGAGPVELRQMALRHGLRPPPHVRVAGVAGSDDHGGLYGGAAHAVLPAGLRSVGEVLDALAAGEVRPAGEDGSASKVAHTGLRIAGSSLRHGEPAGLLPAIRRQLGAFGLPWLPGSSGRARGELLDRLPLLARLGEREMSAALTTRYEERLAQALRGSGSGFPLVDFLGSVGGFIDGHLLLAPYLGVHGYLGRERKKTRALRREVFPGAREEPKKVALVVDGLDGIHGVATMYRNLQALSAGMRAGRMQTVRCGDEAGDDAVRVVRPVATMPVPLYEGLRIGVPSLLDVMDLVAEEDYDVLHVATPGPLGLAALVTGLTLGVPVVGAYHTEFGAYAGALSGDEVVGEIVEVAVREFYERCSAVAVASEATALSLKNRGYRIRRFEVLKNGVDTDLFDPEKRDAALHDSLGGGKTVLLYAGRVSREKGLDGLAAGYMALLRERGHVHLVIVGDGPYRAELEATLGDAATFTGFLRGEELARAFASADVFVFPSATDTLGRAVAEAQASGLPAVVRGTGGPRECIRPGESGFVARGDEELFEKVGLLLEDADLRCRMGRAGRLFAESLSWEAVLDGLISLHARVAADAETNTLAAEPSHAAAT